MVESINDDGTMNVRLPSGELPSGELLENVDPENIEPLEGDDIEEGSAVEVDTASPGYYLEGFDCKKCGSQYLSIILAGLAAVAITSVSAQQLPFSAFRCGWMIAMFSLPSVR